MKLSISTHFISKFNIFFQKRGKLIIFCSLLLIGIINFIINYQNGLGLAYNDARSHLDIGRRVVEGLKPGLAQLGSVWLPLPHLLMIPTVWNDFMWHSGLAGALPSMISFIFVGLLIYSFLEKLKVGLLGRLVGVLIFASNLNILYLQSTAMTELPLLATMTAGAYYLLLYFQKEEIVNLIKAAFFIMLSSLIRYDGWFLLAFSSLLLGFFTWRKNGYQVTEGVILLFGTLAGIGVVLWFLWNAAIFGDPLYFIFGPFSAHAQQTQLDQAGVLATKANLWLSAKVYFYALFYNSYALPAIVGFLGALAMWFNPKKITALRLSALILISPLLFNILALYLGHSVLFIQGISGDTWFNARYGIMLIPSIAVFVGYFINRFKDLRLIIIGLFCFILFFVFVSQDAVTIDDARVGSSQKNVSEVSSYLSRNTVSKEGFILISAASHDAIIFSSNLPMKRFIHEGTGDYWESALALPDRWARWIVMRTNDKNDLVFKQIDKEALKKFNLVDSYPFADVYELKNEYLGSLITKPILGKQK